MGSSSLIKNTTPSAANKQQPKAIQVPATTLKVEPILKYGTTDSILTEAIRAHFIFIRVAADRQPHYKRQVQ